MPKDLKRKRLVSDESSLHKVVIRTRDGKVIPGFAKRELSDPVKIITEQGKEQTFDPEKLKAVFFVKDFKGDPEYDEVKFLDRQKASPMIWVQMEFFDSEVLEGKIENNNVELLSSPGFYLWSSDPDSNNKCVYVIKSSLTNFTILYPV